VRLLSKAYGQVSSATSPPDISSAPIRTMGASPLFSACVPVGRSILATRLTTRSCGSPTLRKAAAQSPLGCITRRRILSIRFPLGTYVMQIPDYPHDLGATYGTLGTVWFRIAPAVIIIFIFGRVSAGCVICARQLAGDLPRTGEKSKGCNRGGRSSGSSLKS
jgi:hypothetical protein